MTRVIINIVLFACIFFGTTSAQQPHSNQYRIEEIYRQFVLGEMGRYQTKIQTDLAKGRQAQHLEQQFLSKAEKFVRMWTAFAREYNQKGTFNIKNAREVSRAFHNLEKSEGWPGKDVH